MNQSSEVLTSVWEKFYQNKVVRFFLSAGIAAVVDVVAYYCIINYIINHQSIAVFNRLLSAHEFSFMISYTLGIFTNFLVTKLTVFNDSTLKSRQQFFRFISVAFLGFFANYALLRFFVEICGFWPTLSRIFSALSLGFAAYYIHKVFTFKKEDINDEL